uniref:MRH domain-containing protein n=1 Tax=Hemiselmis andersenii TaxID=464988 RepID=A0A7S1HI88_HEMAN
MPAIWGQQDAAGSWRFPAGTVLPRDPTSMARIVAIGNAAGERFQCLLPARTKPLNSEWLDIPQVPVVEDIGIPEAEDALRALEGKCFYRNDGWWTYEFCYQSHVRQMHIDPNSNKVVQQHTLGVYSPTAPFELHHQPDRLDHTDNLDTEGPAWTTSLTAVYGGGDECAPGGWWYTCEWVRAKILRILPLTRWAGKNIKRTRPRQVAVSFKCLRVEMDDKRKWLEEANIYLGKDRIPFDLTVEESSPGLYEMTLRSEALCDNPLLYAETVSELSPYGNPNEDIMCQSDLDGRLYKLADVPGDDSHYHEYKAAFHPFDLGQEDV